MNIRSSDGRWIDLSNACRNVPPPWTETSYSYSACLDVNTHTRIERCVMYRSSFRTVPSFLNPRANTSEYSAHNTWTYSVHNTWTTLWSFRSFSSKTQSSFILSTTITEQWKFSYRILHISKTIYPFWMYPYKLWFHCPLTIQKSVSQNSQNYLYFIKKRFITKTTQGNRIGVAPFLQGETQT